MRMLVIAAHPDDEVLGCGGCIARVSGQSEVFTTIVTEGCSSQYSGENIDSMICGKKAAAEKAGRILGVKKVIFGDFPDMRLDTVGHTALNGFLERVIDEIRPDIVLTHHSGDINLDHQIIYRSTIVAVRPGKGYPTRVLLYETPSATEWQSYNAKYAFIPNLFVDITRTIERKIEALRCYETELRNFPHPRSEQGVRAYAAFRGLAAGVRAAEGYTLFREVC